MKVGRPTDYTPELIEKAKYYLHGAAAAETFPQIADFAIYLGISRETVYAWTKDEDKSEFSDVVSEILAAQERELVQKGLKGEFNASITKLMLTKHGYRESSDVTTDGKALPTPILNGLSNYNGNPEDSETEKED